MDGGLDQEGQGLLEDLGGRPRLLQALEGAAGPLLVAELVKGLAEQEQRLGLDATTGGADYQRFNRVRNRIRSITRNAALNEMQQNATMA